MQRARQVETPEDELLSQNDGTVVGENSADDAEVDGRATGAQEYGRSAFLEEDVSSGAKGLL